LGTVTAIVSLPSTLLLQMKLNIQFYALPLIVDLTSLIC
jgi:hypothetical protein